MFIPDPITAPWQYGAAFTSCVFCAGLYIWSSLRDDKKDKLLKDFNTKLTDHMELEEKNLIEVKEAIKATNDSQREFMEGQKEMQRDIVQSQKDFGEGLTRIAEALQEQSRVNSAIHSQNMEKLNSQTVDLKILITQQMQMTGSLQHFIETVFAKVPWPTQA